MEKISAVNNIVFVDDMYDDIFNSVFTIEYHDLAEFNKNIDEKDIAFYSEVITKIYISLILDKKIQESVKNFLDNIDKEIEFILSKLKEENNISVDLKFNKVEYLYFERDEVLNMLGLNSNLISVYISDFELNPDDFGLIGFKIEFEHNGKLYNAVIKLMAFQRLFKNVNGVWIESINDDDEIFMFVDYLNAYFNENITKDEIVGRINKINNEVLDLDFGSDIFENKIKTNVVYEETNLENSARNFFERLKADSDNYALNLRMYIVEGDNRYKLKFPYNKWKEDEMFFDGVFKTIVDTFTDNVERDKELSEIKGLYQEHKDFLIGNAGFIEKEIEKIFNSEKNSIKLKYFTIERTEFIYHHIDKNINFDLDYDYYPIGSGFILSIDNKKVFLSKLFNLPVFPVQFENKLTENYIFADSNIVDEIYRLFIILTGIHAEVKYFNPYAMKEMNLNGEPIFNKYYIS